MILPLYEVVQTFKTSGNSSKRSTVTEPEKRASGSVKDSPLGGSSVRDGSLGGSSNRGTILSDAPSSFTDTLRSDKSTVKSDTSSVTPTQPVVPVTTAGNDYDNIITTVLLCSLKSFYLPWSWTRMRTQLQHQNCTFPHFHNIWHNVLGPVYTERQHQRCDNSAMMLAILFSLKSMELQPILDGLHCFQSEQYC